MAELSPSELTPVEVVPWQHAFQPRCPSCAQVRGCDPASDRFRVVKFNLDSYAFDPQRPRAPQKNRVQFQVVGAKGVVCALSTVLDEEYGLALVNGRVQLLPWEVLDYVLAFLRPPGAQRT